MEDHIDSRWSQEALANIISAFHCETPMRLGNLEADNILSVVGKKCEGLFTAGVAMLRSSRRR